MNRSVLLATSAEWRELTPDDRPLLISLRDRGLSAAVQVWSEPAASIPAPYLIVIRSCWDYHRRYHEFLDWIAAEERRGSLFANPAPVLRWNGSKRYLLDLQTDGVPVVATTVLSRAAGNTSDQIRRVQERVSHGDSVVFKPAISATAHGLWRAPLPLAPETIARVEEMLDRGDVLMQPFRPSITALGETSLIYFRGVFSHAVLKRPAQGDFRVQAEFGGRVEAAVPSPAARREADNALHAAARRAQIGRRDLIYARIDLIDAPAGIEVMEVELIEPSLFLAGEVPAISRFADAILAAVRA